jgi:hypothetical protein
MHRLSTGNPQHRPPLPLFGAADERQVHVADLPQRAKGTAAMPIHPPFGWENDLLTDRGHDGILVFSTHRGAHCRCDDNIDYDDCIDMGRGAQ